MEPQTSPDAKPNFQAYLKSAYLEAASSRLRLRIKIGLVSYSILIFKVTESTSVLLRVNFICSWGSVAKGCCEVFECVD